MTKMDMIVEMVIKSSNGGNGGDGRDTVGYGDGANSRMC